MGPAPCQGAFAVGRLSAGGRLPWWLSGKESACRCHSRWRGCQAFCPSRLWGAPGQHRALHKSSSVKHGLPPRVSSWEQLGRKEKDKKPADSTMSRWPSFQKRKRSPLLKCFSMEKVAVGCSGWVFDPGPPPGFPAQSLGWQEKLCVFVHLRLQRHALGTFSG